MFLELRKLKAEDKVYKTRKCKSTCSAASTIMKAKKGKSTNDFLKRRIKLSGGKGIFGGMGGPAGRGAVDYKKYLEGLKKVTQKASTLPTRKITEGALKAAKATRIGKIAAGVAGAALAAKYGLEKMYEKRTGKKPFTKRPKKSVMEGDLEGSIKPYVKKKMVGGIMKVPGGYAKEGLGRISDKSLKGKSPQQRFSELEKMRESTKKFPKMRKKMGGGMMMKRPMGYSKGTMMDDIVKNMGKDFDYQTKIKYRKKSKGAPDQDPMKAYSEAEVEAAKSVKKKYTGKMGGGMMQRPMMAMGGGMMPGYKKGKSVMAKGCKLGRKKPTKMYT